MGGLEGGCKERWGNGLRRNVLLDGVLGMVFVFEVVVETGFASIEFSEVVFFTGVTM